MSGIHWQYGIYNSIYILVQEHQVNMLSFQKVLDLRFNVYCSGDV